MEALNTLKSSVDEWLLKYVLRASTEGKIVFARMIQENQYVEHGKLIGYVLPPDNLYYVELKIQQSNFGKIAQGLKVQLRFDAYPYQETGYVSGTLDYLSSVSVDSMFLGTVRLDNGLLTSQNKNHTV